MAISGYVPGGNQARVISGSEVKEVKNLGWLLRHAARVESMDISALPHGEAYMVAFLYDGRRYETHWASLEVCKTWIKRPSLRHVDVEIGARYRLVHNNLYNYWHILDHTTFDSNGRYRVVRDASELGKALHGAYTHWSEARNDCQAMNSKVEE